jgi:ribulose-5-phosphate 4-epimerase/fuculose-1-phosphate aldolase
MTASGPDRRKLHSKDSATNAEIVIGSNGSEIKLSGHSRDGEREEKMNMRFFTGFASLIGILLVISTADAQLPPPPVAATTHDQLIEQLVAANRILANEGMLDGYGHVSVRDLQNPNHYWMSRSIAPMTVTADDIIEYDLDSNPIDAQGRGSYYERFIHGEIYKVRPDVNVIIHSHSPTVIPFSTTKVPLRAMMLNAAFLGAGAPVFDIRKIQPNSDLMISTPLLGKAVAAELGQAAVVLLRGHGDVVVGPSVPVAVFRAYYTEVNARQQAQAIALGGGDVIYLTPEEAETADKANRQGAGRPWDLWKKKVGM